MVGARMLRQVSLARDELWTREAMVDRQYRCEQKSVPGRLNAESLFGVYKTAILHKVSEVA